MPADAIYVSPSSIRSLWQEYRVFADRLELATMFGTIRIPFENVDAVSERPPLLKQLATGEIFCRKFRPGVKLDIADLAQHVEIDRNDATLVRRLLITPDDPAAFVAAAQKAQAAWTAANAAQ